MVLADEINRTPPKTQAALLEAMQERQVSAGASGTLCPTRFSCWPRKIRSSRRGHIRCPKHSWIGFCSRCSSDIPAKKRSGVYRLTTSDNPAAPAAVVSGDEMLKLQGIVRRVPVSDLCVEYIARLVRSTRPTDPAAPKFIRDWVHWGVGPRGGQSLIMAGRARAALDGRPEVDVDDIRAMAAAVLRHRIVLNYNAESEGQTGETVIKSSSIHWRCTNHRAAGAGVKSFEVTAHGHLNPKMLARIMPLGLRAQRVVEGSMSGLHRSPLHGVSVEFARLSGIHAGRRP